MKTYVILTDSHRVFLDNYFLPTYPYEPGMDLIVRYVEQTCPTGEYNSPGYNKTMLQKTNMILEIIERSPYNEHFFYSCVDVQFFGKIRDDLSVQLGDYDIVWQDGGRGSICAGIFIAKANHSVWDLFDTIRRGLERGEFKDDQTAAQHYVRVLNIKSGLLDNRYWLTGKLWNGEDVDVPGDILLHHAAWTIGIDNKIKLLNLVRGKHGK